jgi:hypothetical protein
MKGWLVMSFENCFITHHSILWAATHTCSDQTLAAQNNALHIASAGCRVCVQRQLEQWTASGFAVQGQDVYSHTANR